ncbi:MAG: phosphatase PAP2 family protein, partial [Actinomycetota bacterium]|nr:phosphatase PAP2 family protein [Actinomycetota bacterium]
KRTERRAVRYYVHAAARPRVRAFLGAQLLWVLSYAALPSFFVLYAADVLKLTAAEASLILSGFGLATAAAVVAAARAREPEHQRTLLGMGVSLMAIGFLGVAAAGDIFAALGALLAAGIGFGLVTTLGFSLFSSLIPAGEEGGYTAMFFSVRAVASAVALPAAGWAIAATGSYRALFLFAGAAATAALLPLARVGLASCERRALQAPETPWLLRWGVELVALAGILLAAGHLLGRTGLQRLDEAVFELVNSLGPGPEFLWDALNPHTRNYVLLGVLAAAAAAATSVRLVYPVVALVVVSALVSWGLLELVYAGFDRPRPEEVLGPGHIVLDGNTWGHIESFPSGHMAITTALAAATALAFPRLRGVLWTYVAAVGFTRVLFGAHFPLDTVAGVVLGYVVARAVYGLFVEAGVFERRKGETRWLAALTGERSRPA